MCLLAAAIASALLAACGTPRHTGRPPSAPVLGQTSGTPQLVGQPAPTGTGQLGAVACADAAHCWAVGIPPAAASPVPATAATVVTVIAATSDGGATWVAQHLSLTTAPDLTGISCPGPKVCMAVGSTGTNSPSGTVLTTLDGGRDWHEVGAPSGALAVTSVVCASSDDCTALVSDGTIIWSASTFDFGHTWQREGNLPAGFEAARALSCTGGTCVVAGNTPTTTGRAQGAIALSTDGGTTWSVAAVPTGTGLLQTAVCASSLRCLAGGTTSNAVSAVVPAHGALLISGDAGRHWFPTPKAPPVDDVFAIACPLAQRCAMVGTRWVGGTSVGVGSAALSTNAGASFTQTTTAYAPLTLTALACPTAVSCIAVGGDTVARMQLVTSPLRPTRPSSTTPRTTPRPAPIR